MSGREGFHVKACLKGRHHVGGASDSLSPETIRAALQTEIIGREVYVYDRVDSTNLEAKRLAERGAREGTVVIAEEQTQGRGRLDRRWLSPAGENLLFSVIFRPDLKVAQAFRLTMVSSLAVVSAVQGETDLSPLIKWPNDVYIGGKKVCGILTELSPRDEGIGFAVVGIGINVNFDPTPFKELEETATSLVLESGMKVSRGALLKEVLKALDANYCALMDGQVEKLRSLWTDLSLLKGKFVRVTTGSEVHVGVAEDFEADGCMILAFKGGERKRITSGDASLVSWQKG
jgi:BirA family biotin operon repressor/biotin-[acetyl-CoA-carboxylase] ligase